MAVRVDFGLLLKGSGGNNRDLYDVLRFRVIRAFKKFVTSGIHKSCDIDSSGLKLQTRRAEV